MSRSSASSTSAIRRSSASSRASSSVAMSTASFPICSPFVVFGHCQRPAGDPPHPRRRTYQWGTTLTCVDPETSSALTGGPPRSVAGCATRPNRPRYSSRSSLPAATSRPGSAPPHKRSRTGVGAVSGSRHRSVGSARLRCGGGRPCVAGPRTPPASGHLAGHGDNPSLIHPLIHKEWSEVERVEPH